MKFPCAILAAFALLPGATRAFWILDHGSLTQDRLDPIVEAGRVSSHVHNIVGGSAFAATLDASTMARSNCTTSPVQADRSNYWVPQLYHRDATNGSYTLIPLISTKTYYLQRAGPTNTTIAAFPAGLRMVAGNMNRTTFNESNVADRAVSFVCLDPAASAGPINQFPDQNCQSGLRAQINFPGCWNGKDLDSPDHMSHMAYPIDAPDSGDCPEGYIKTINLFNEWVFDVGTFPFVSGAKNWVFSTGDDTGLGFHADFVNGWEQSVLESAVAQCDTPIFGNLEQCPPFVASLDRDRATSCKTAPLVAEDIVGPLAALPGCNPTPYNSVARCDAVATPSIRSQGGPAPTASAPSVAATATASASAGGPPKCSLVAPSGSEAASGSGSGYKLKRRAAGVPVRKRHQRMSLFNRHH